MFPHQEPCVRGPPSKDLYQVLRGESSYTRLLMKEPSKVVKIRAYHKNPPRGGGSFDQLGPLAETTGSLTEIYIFFFFLKEILGPLAEIPGSFVEMYGAFAERKGSFLRSCMALLRRYRPLVWRYMYNNFFSP